MSSKQVVACVCPHSSCLISSLRGLRNGLYYGGRIRLMHSIVMTILFQRHKSLKDNLVQMLQVTVEHAKNLGTYVFIYKLLVCVMNRLRGTQSKYHALIAGTIAGYSVFRKQSSVNYQIVLYILSRVIYGSVEKLVHQGHLPNWPAYKYFAGLVWGVVMLLFEDDSMALQSSLRSSMQFLYKDTDKKVERWEDLLPFQISWPTKKNIHSNQIKNIQTKNK